MLTGISFSMISLFISTAYYLLGDIDLKEFFNRLLPFSVMYVVKYFPGLSFVFELQEKIFDEWEF